MKKIVCLLVLVLFSLPMMGLAASSFTFADKDGDLLAGTQCHRIRFA